MLCQELVIIMATAFWQACFPKFVIFVFPVLKINFNAIHFYVFTVNKHNFIDFLYFAVILGGFLAFLKNFKIQDGGSKMAAVLTS